MRQEEPISERRDISGTETTVQTGRDLLDKRLDSYRHEKLKRTAPVDQQHLNICQEDMALKRKFDEAMSKSEGDT